MPAKIPKEICNETLIKISKMPSYMSRKTSGIMPAGIQSKMPQNDS
jgi:hypothetical protein